LDRDIVRQPKALPQPRQPVANNAVPRELVLSLLAQGYPLEELVEFFPMFTLDQLLILMDDEIIH
jgi:hypothetical protein